MRTGPSSKRNRRLAAALTLCLLALLAASAPARGAGEPRVEGSIADLWSRGESAFAAGDLAGALRLYEAALARDERSARSWNYVGGVHFAQGDFPRALEDFRTALQLDPRDVRACNNLGTALDRLGDYAGARKAYEQAVLLDPSHALTQRNIGILESRRLGNPDAARRAWRRYLELAPTGAHAEEIRRELDALPGAQPPAPPAPPPASARVNSNSGVSLSDK